MMRFLETMLFNLIFGFGAHAAAPFDSLSLQGFLKSAANVPVNGTYNGRITLYQNSAPCWNSGATLVPIAFADGAFVKTLSAGVSSGLCSGSLGSNQFKVAGPFTWTLALDIDGDNTAETSFTNIPITPVPLAMVAESISSAIAGDLVNGGTFGAVDASNLTNLNAGALATGLISAARLGLGTANSTTYLRGDGSWSAVSGLGEVNTASNQGSGAGVFKTKSGVDLQFKSLLAGSTKLSIAGNASDITLDLVEANLSLANIGGTLSGSKVSGGALGAASGANLTNLNATNISSGTVPTARLGSGTADSTTYLRGDGAWVSGSALTNLNGSAINSGTVPAANLPVADASNAGMVSAGAQTLAGAKTLNGALTLNSVLSLTKTDVATAAAINCLATTSSLVRLTGTTTTSLNGINPGADGQIMIVYTDGNVGTTLTVAHNNASGCANGKIFTNANANVTSTVATSTAAFIFVYNLASLRWHMISALQ